MSEDVFYKLLIVVCLTWTAARLVKLYLTLKNIDTDKTYKQIEEEKRQKRIDELYGR